MHWVYRAAVAMGGLLQLTACDQWALSVGGDGLLFIAVVGDTHELPGRYRVRVRQADGFARVLGLPESGRLNLDGFPSGPLELTLLPPPGCQVSSPNPLTVTVEAEQSVDLTFDVDCS